MNIEGALKRLAADNFTTGPIGSGRDIQIRGRLKRQGDKDSDAEPRLCVVI